MKKPAYILLLMCLTSLSFAQERFYHIYEGWVCNEIKESEINYSTWGLEVVPVSGGYKLIRQSLSHDGEFDSVTNEYLIDPYITTTVYSSNNFAAHTENSTYIAAYIKYAYNSFYPLFVKYDEVLQDTVFSRIYTDLLPDMQVIFMSILHHN